jgi:hypothetical protein
MRNACAWVAAAGLLVGSASSASAQEAAAVRQEIDQLRRDFETLKQQYGDRLTALESKLAAVEGAAPAAAQPPAAPPAAAQPPATQPPATPPAAEVPSGAAGAGGPTGALPVYGSTVGGAKVFNPDIAVIGDFLGAAGHNSVNPQPGFEMHESEASFQAVVDPYARPILPVVRRGGRHARGRLRHADGAAGRSADEGREDARRVRQGQHDAQPRAAVDRSAARHAEPRRRRRRHRRRGHLGGAA